MRNVFFSFAKTSFHVFLSSMVLVSLSAAWVSYSTSAWITPQISVKSPYRLMLRPDGIVREVNNDEQLRDGVSIYRTNIPLRVKNLNLYNDTILLRAQILSPPSPPAPPPLPLPIPKPNPLFISCSILLLQYINENIKIV